MTIEASSRTSAAAAGLFTLVVAILGLPALGLVHALTTGGGSPPLVVADAVSDSVGGTAAQFRVDESGAATYTIPLYTVPGRAGVAPSLTLSYSSQGGEGPVGKGWSIGGLSSITRCRATREAGDFIVGGVPTDGTPAPVNFTASDRFCLDGQRLVPANDSCGSAGGYTGVSWRTEVDTFQRVCSFGPSVADPKFFTVGRKDGSASYYGDRDNATTANRPDGYFESTSPGFTTYAQTWAQTRMQDWSGNTIDFKWLENPSGAGNGELLIGEVQFTGKILVYNQPGTPSSPFAKIVFNYSARPTADWTTSFVSGGLMRQTRRLDSITSCSTIACAQADQVRYYQLTYATSASNSRVDTLTSVQECRDASKAVCLGPTTFTWSDARNQLAGSDGWQPGYFGSTRKFEGFKFGDVDGDGRVDMVWLKDGSTGDQCPTEHIMVAFGTNDGVRQTFRAPVMSGCTPTEVMTGLGEDSWQLFDYNGDGRDDFFVAGALNTKYYLYPSQGDVAQPFDTSTDLLASIAIPMLYQDTSSGTMHPQLTDFNGDGLMDVLYKTQGTPTYRVRLMERQGSTWGWGAERGVTITSNAALSCPPEAIPDSCVINAGQIWNPDLTRLVDFDGDAGSDLMFTQAVRWKELADCDDPNPRNCGIINTAIYVFPAHATSITATTITFENIGDSFMGDRNAITPMPMFGDINGDGLTDVVYRRSSDFAYALNTGRGFLASIAIGALPIPELAKLADVNGDGRSDFLYVNTTADAANPMHYLQRQALRSGGFGAPTTIAGDKAFACLGNACDPKTYATMFTDLDADGALDYFAMQMGSDTPNF
jgi:hypothetical protein